MEILLSRLAADKIREAAEQNNEEKTVRLYVEGAGCSGAKFGIAFDDIKDGDVVSKIDDITFITDTQYIPMYSDGLDVDYVSTPKEGFVISSIRQVKGYGCGGGCSGCSGCGH